MPPWIWTDSLTTRSTASTEWGAVLGITRQAAFKRFGSPRDPRTGGAMRAPLTRDVVLGTWARAVADAENTVGCRDTVVELPDGTPVQAAQTMLGSLVGHTVLECEAVTGLAASHSTRSVGSPDCSSLRPIKASCRSRPSSLRRRAGHPVPPRPRERRRAGGSVIGCPGSVVRSGHEQRVANALADAVRRGTLATLKRGSTGLRGPPATRLKAQSRAGFVGYHGPGSCVRCQHTVC
jgi:hypothetical protein